jgi:hypothetical protein
MNTDIVKPIWGDDDCEWFAFDSKDNLCFFTTGGFNAYYSGYKDSIEKINELRGLLLSSPKLCDYTITPLELREIGLSSVESWAEMSERGVIGFDYNHKDNCFRQITKPLINAPLNKAMYSWAPKFGGDLSIAEIIMFNSLINGLDLTSR